ncbi:hypothetical protein ACFQ5N_05975 [Lutibacter holmesii]|uniref:Tetratricopeptide repeat protein n=1 Tax=Lutibacter holmesii TaxID=1137985 RepID=A0ABW3WNV6_9FLAO
MNSTDFTNLLQNPSQINASKTELLNEVIEMYPYFQSARAIQLKALKTTNSFKYNQALKKTAAYTTDRKVLFDFITSQNFIKNTYKEIHVLEEIEVIDPETIEALQENIEEITVEENNTPATQNDAIEELLEIGKPIQFKSTEPHSFNEWMQLISKKTIDRTEIQTNTTKKNTKNEDKFHLIDKFIEAKPKIKPVDKNAVFQDITPKQTEENESLMTETLAKVYLEQKKYGSAIKAYRILSLKYPEKSGFFADRIKAIKTLQKNKS